MPIVFVHGVSTRDYHKEHALLWTKVEDLLRRYVAPTIAPDPHNVAIIAAYWGDIGVKFHYNGASRPQAKSVNPLNSIMMRVLQEQDNPDMQNEAWQRAGDFIGYMTGRAIDPIRDPINEQVLLFLGDIFRYFHHRGTPEKPGLIVERVLDSLRIAKKNQEFRPQEPLIVFSHSMGGQIIYDIITSFLPVNDALRDLHIDFWVGASSQVGLFEEMKVFLASNDAYKLGYPVPFPNKKYLGHWWNMWDSNDFLSFTTKNIFAGVDDTPFDSGLAPTDAHVGCLTRASFYTLFAEKARIYCRR